MNNKPIKKRFVALALGAALLVPTVVHADVYMQSPRGSNDRISERSEEPNALESFVNWVRGLF